MADDQGEKIAVAVRQLERAEDYLQGAANALPELEEEVDRMLDGVEVLKHELTRRRLAS